MASLRFDLAVPTRSFDVELALEVGRETVALVGPSGAGKTTLLRGVAGLAPARGRIACDGETWLDSARRWFSVESAGASTASATSHG